jgi:nitrate reductase gamma subunit
VFLLGSLIRYDRRAVFVAGELRLLRRSSSRSARTCSHLGILFPLFGHAVGLLAPKAVYLLSLPSSRSSCWRSSPAASPASCASSG